MSLTMPLNSKNSSVIKPNLLHGDNTLKSIFFLISRLLNGAFCFPRKGSNNDKAHPPIHPVLPGNDLSGDDKKVYEFIVRRFLACCSEKATGEQTRLVYKIGTQQFTATGIYA